MGDSVVAEQRLLVAQDTQSTALVSELVVLAAAGPPDSRFTWVGEQTLLAATQGSTPVTQVAEQTMLVAFVTGPRAVFNQRAFGFTLDGHPFYVLSLGTLGTFVYDVSTQTWSNWETQGYGVWNFEQGVEWNGGIYGGDQLNATIWKLNPDSFLDDGFRPIVRVVTGGIQVTERQTVQMGGFYLQTFPQTAVTGDVPMASLSVSRDNGKTFVSADQTLSVSGANAQEFAWRSLGTARYPGAIFRVTDTGGLTRIELATLKIPGER